MKLYEFLRLSDDNQYQAVWDKGKHVDNVAKDNIIYQLYAINDFYVEIQYSVPDNKIIGKVQFKYGEHLEKYLPNLNK